MKLGSLPSFLHFWSSKTQSGYQVEVVEADVVKADVGVGPANADGLSEG
jgi:hypothetical protein